MFTNNALKAISEYGKKYLVGGPSSEDGFQDQQPRLLEMEGLRLILGGGLLMRKFWAKEEQSEALEPVLDQEEINSISEETEAVLSGKDPSLSREEEQLLLPGGRGSVVSNRDVQLQVGAEQLTSNRDVDVQVETEPVSKTDVTVQTDEDTEIEDLRLKNEIMAKELANKQAVIQGQENQLATYYQSILELKAELKMARQKNDAHIQMQSELMGEKEALKRELEGKVTLIEENTVKMVQLNEELEKAKKEIEAHDELKSILLSENEDLKKSNEERSFLNEELALEKIKLEKKLVEARSNDQKRSQGHQRLVEELQVEISISLVQNRELKEAVFTITKKNEGLREQLENKGKREKNLNGKIVRMTNTQDQMKKELSAAKDVISSLKKELQKRDLEKVKKEGTGDKGSPGKEKCGLDKTSVVEGCETPAEDDKKTVIVKEENQEGEGPTRKLLGKETKEEETKTGPGLLLGPPWTHSPRFGNRRK
ncbi:golgin subfamily A member 6-like protein 7 [Palaemon carinicauda]|uniref:golgin subfamily A member 6-like protein 7 n=1 Tax=Palaemon carinicauda TaxID=392227 RepID=UPI0035B57E44